MHPRCSVEANETGELDPMVSRHRDVRRSVDSRISLTGRLFTPRGFDTAREARRDHVAVRLVDEER